MILGREEIFDTIPFYQPTKCAPPESGSWNTSSVHRKPQQVQQRTSSTTSSDHGQPQQVQQRTSSVQSRKTDMDNTSSGPENSSILIKLSLS